MRGTPWCLALVVIGAASLSAQPPPLPFNVAHPLPPQPPAWREGFQVRWPVRVVGLAGKQLGQSVVVSLPSGGWLKPDGSDLAVVGPSGELLPMQVLSHVAKGNTLIQFPRVGNENWYSVYGVGASQPSPAPNAEIAAKLREGISIEGRAWSGGALDSWEVVRAGLEKSGPVLASMLVPEVVQRGNPARLDQPQQFATSHRGYLQIPADGAYRFLVNADDASFLFIDGFKVFERKGTNTRLGQAKVADLDKLAGKIDLKSGLHPFEVHHAVGTNPQSQGTLLLLWSPPGETKFTLVPHTAFPKPLIARAAAVEYATNQRGASFVCGIDDTLEVAGLKLFLVRCEAHGDVPDADLKWEMGDGTQRTGRSILHVYFQVGDFDISVRGGSLPPFQRRLRVWPEPGEISPFSLENAVAAIGAMEWKKLPPPRVREVFSFLSACEQPSRWPLIDQVAQFLLLQPDLDLETKAQLVSARIDAMARQGRAGEALKYAAEAMPSFAKTPALLVRVQMAAASVQQYHLKDFAAASAIYKKILDDNSRVEHPNLRLAGVRWGDLFAETGDLDRASQTYRIAATLGGEKAAPEQDPSARGALLRIAEQKLKGGELVQTRQLLAKMEIDYPGRRLDGLYCFLHAESDRLSGHYDDALRHYEMILRLPQWAGYRDRASFGIADTCLRQGDLERAQKWIATLKESFPKYYEDHQGAELAERLAQRQAIAKGSAGPASFSSLQMTFEPDETLLWGDIQSTPVVRALAMSGTQAMLVEAFDKDPSYYDYYRNVTGTVPGATYLAEFWWCELVRTPPPLSHQQPHLGFNYIATGAQGDGVGTSSYLYDVTPGEWHKSTIKLKMPPGSEGKIRFRFNNLLGSFLFDRLSIQLVEERRIDALANFLESTKGP